jgi:two-component system, response regulator PdtaR
MSKVMIAEDDLVMADMLADILVHSGYEVCGIARTVDQAVHLCERHKPDLAILDLRLSHGEVGTEIATRLRPRGNFGILYTTGNVGQMGGLTKADGDACMRKPYRAEDVVLALKIVEKIVGNDTVEGPFPQGFQVLT